MMELMVCTDLAAPLGVLAVEHGRLTKTIKLMLVK
jgi:hypothetical protein